MRYLIAMVFALLCAALAFYFLGVEIANWVVDQLTCDDPVEVGTAHSMVFLAVCIGGLLVGWVVGWVIGGPLAEGERPPR